MQSCAGNKISCYVKKEITKLFEKRITFQVPFSKNKIISLVYFFYKLRYFFRYVLAVCIYGYNNISFSFQGFRKACAQGRTKTFVLWMSYNYSSCFPGMLQCAVFRAIVNDNDL